MLRESWGDRTRIKVDVSIYFERIGTGKRETDECVSERSVRLAMFRKF